MVFEKVQIEDDRLLITRGYGILRVRFPAKVQNGKADLQNGKGLLQNLKAVLQNLKGLLQNE
ncbi:hypothetical protein K8I61_04985 [bacterium]|nr:hypothetical protein [bacterium]